MLDNHLSPPVSSRNAGGGAALGAFPFQSHSLSLPLPETSSAISFSPRSPNEGSLRFHERRNTEALSPHRSMPGSISREPETMFSWMDRMKMKKREDAQSFLFETTLYLVFMCVFGSVTYTSFNSWTFFFVDNIQDQLLRPNFIPDKNFYGMNNADDFFTWCGSILLPTLFPETNYTGARLSDYDQRFFNWHNYRVGRLRLRQVRMQRNQGCRVNADFSKVITDCIGMFDPGSEEKSTFGGWNNSESPVQTAFEWKSAEQLCNNNFGDRYCSSIMYGVDLTQYSDSGYVWDFTSDLNQSLAELDELQNQLWLDFQTSVVFVDFTLYNANIQLVCGVHLMVEFFPTGAVYVSESIKPLPLFTLETSKNVGVLIGEIFMTFMVVLYILREFYEFMGFFKIERSRCTRCQMVELKKKHGPRLVKCFECAREYNIFRLPSCPQCGMETAFIHQCWRGYFMDGWNIIDIFNQSFFLWVLATRFTLRADMVKVDYNVGDKFMLFYPLAYFYDFSNWVNAANALMCFTKTFKYLEKFRSLSVLTKLIYHGKKHILPFIVVFVFIFVGFSLSYSLAFGVELFDYRSWVQAMISLLRVMFGDFDYPTLHASNRMLGPFLFVLFLVVTVFILLSIFLAIVSDSFEQIQQDLLQGRDDYDTSSLKILLSSWRMKLHKMGFGFATNPLYDNIQILIANFDKCRELEMRQIDDMRAFRNEVELNPDNVHLFSAIVKAFNGKVDKVMSVADYNLLKETVQRFRRTTLEEDIAAAQATGLEPDEDALSQSGGESSIKGKLTLSAAQPTPLPLARRGSALPPSMRRNSSAQYLDAGKHPLSATATPRSARSNSTTYIGVMGPPSQGGGSYAFEVMMPDIEARAEIMVKHINRIRQALDNRERRILGMSDHIN